MFARAKSWWFDIRQGLWFVPAVLTGAAVVLALVTLWLDQTFRFDRREDLRWLFGSGVDGARGVLQAIAGTMITVTALVFSITVVALQLVSSQLSPRVLRLFMADCGNQVVLGFFIGTFTYALLVVRAVRSPLEDSAGFVPSLSVTVAIALALVSVALLIFFVHHAANAMRASVVIDRAAHDTLALITDLYPEGPMKPHQTGFSTWWDAIPASTVRAQGSGYLQTIKREDLIAVAERETLTLRVDLSVGEFVLPNAPVVSVWPRDALDDDVAETIGAGLVLGPERTLQADVGFGIQQLTDIAVKALSPGINDPTTASICIDRLSEVLVRLASRIPPDEVVRGQDGRVLIILPRQSFAQLVSVAFDQIRFYGADNPEVADKLLTTLGQIVVLIPTAHRAPIVQQARLVLAAIRTQAWVLEDRERVVAAGSWVDQDPGA